MVKYLPANTGDERDMVSIPGSGRSTGIGNDNPFQYSCLENSIYREESGGLQSTQSQSDRHYALHTKPLRYETHTIARKKLGC